MNAKCEEKLKLTRQNIARFWSGKEAPQLERGNKQRHIPPAAACTLACKLNKENTIKISVTDKHDYHMGQTQLLHLAENQIHKHFMLIGVGSVKMSCVFGTDIFTSDTNECIIYIISVTKAMGHCIRAVQNSAESH